MSKELGSTWLLLKKPALEMLARKSIAAFLARSCPPSCSYSPCLPYLAPERVEEGGSFQNKRNKNGKGGQGETPGDRSQMENSGHPASDPLSVLTGLRSETSYITVKSPFT